MNFWDLEKGKKYLCDHYKGAPGYQIAELKYIDEEDGRYYFEFTSDNIDSIHKNIVGRDFYFNKLELKRYSKELYE